MLHVSPILTDFSLPWPKMSFLLSAIFLCERLCHNTNGSNEDDILICQINLETQESTALQ